jgi:small subunit ribosomal protein S18
MTSTPKTPERMSNFRRNNRRMPRRRMDIPVDQIDYKNIDLLTKFTSDTGKILGRRITGVAMHVHRKLVREIKRARAVNLLP